MVMDDNHENYMKYQLEVTWYELTNQNAVFP